MSNLGPEGILFSPWFVTDFMDHLGQATHGLSTPSKDNAMVKHNISTLHTTPGNRGHVSALSLKAVLQMHQLAVLVEAYWNMCFRVCGMDAVTICKLE